MYRQLILVIAACVILIASPARAADPCQSITFAPVGDAPGPTLVPPAPSDTCGDYPPISARLQENGSAILDVQVMTDGTVGAVSLVQSSGKPRLDQAALKIAKLRIHFRLTNTASDAVTRRISIGFKVINIIRGTPSTGTTVVPPPSDDTR